MAISMQSDQTYPPLGPAKAAWLLVTRSFIVYRQAWKLFLTGR